MVNVDPLTEKIKSFLDEKSFYENREFINIIFDPKSDYYKNERLNTIKVVETLKENGLLNLFFDSPREFRLNFTTSGSPLFFVKIMSDTFRNIGYYRYVTVASHMDASEFGWSINLQSEYATDPLILQQELQKSGCSIVDIQRVSAEEWTYTIDMTGGYLNVPLLQNGKIIELKRSLYAHWLDVSQVQELEIKSSLRNQWYPYIAYYDASLHLLKIIKENQIHRVISLEIPKNAKYVKIADLYTLKNVKDELRIFPKGSK
ncbi:MAG: hypothetical protein JXQ67_10750 [Campylobacterales bacterium]|nr:hypothetical protein [Campylobacterales bacterium]